MADIAKIQNLLTDSLRRLGISQKGVDEACIIKDAAQVIRRLFPADYEKIKPLSFREGVLKIAVSDHYLAQEVVFKLTPEVLWGSCKDKRKIRICR